MSLGGNLTLRDKLGWGFFRRLLNDGTRPVGLFEGADKTWSVTEPGGHSSTSAQNVNADTALQVSAVLAACRVISQAVAQVEKQVVIREFDEEKARFTHKIIPNDPLWKLLCEQPNHFQTPFEFYESITLLAVLCGNSYSYINTPSGIPVELIPIMNDSIEVITTANKELKYKVSVSGGSPLYLNQNQVLHIRGPGMGGPIAIDILNIAREVLGLAQVTELAHGESMRRRGRLDGIVAAEGELDQTAATRIRDAFVQRFGAGGDGGVAFLDRGAKFHSVTQSASDMQLIEHRKHLVDEVGRVFGVYSQLLNQNSNNSAYASIEQVFMAHLTNTIEPWLVRVEQAIKRDVIGFASTRQKKRLRADRTSLVPSTMKDRAEYIQTISQNGLLTFNEGREMIGLNPSSEPGADRPTTQMNMKIGYENPEPAPVQAAPTTPGEPNVDRLRD